VTNSIFKQIWRFFWVILIQTFVLEHIEVFSFINPSIYVYFLLLLPREWSKLIHLLIGFITGYVLDSLGDSAGLHTSSSVFLTFLAPIWLNSLNQREKGNEVGAHGPDQLALGPFLLYSFPLIWAHQIFLYSIEYFEMGKLFSILYYGTINFFFTGVLVFIARYFPTGFRKDNSR